MQLIPAIDLRNGRCVRLFKGDFDAETVYADDPTEVLARYRALGASYIHIVDLDGAREGTQANLPSIERLATGSDIGVQVGGGLRSLDRVQDLLARGVRRAVIGSIAINEPDTVIGWLEQVQASRLVLALDIRLAANGTPMLTTHGWLKDSGTSLWDVVERFAGSGIEHVLCTDVGRDGALSGPNCELYAQAVRRYPQLQWQASGGVSSAADLHALRDTGVAAVISGKALLENKISFEDLQPFLPNASFPA